MIALGAVLVFAVPDLRHAFSLSLHGHFGKLRHFIRGLGGEGVALLLALMLAHAIVIYPTEIVTATAGFVYGFLPGLALALGGWMLSGLLSYAIGRVVGRPLLRRMLGERFERLEATIQGGGVHLLLIGRLIPIVPFSLMGYAAGATRVNVKAFAWTTVVGYIPLCAAVAYLGSRSKTLSIEDPFLWLAVGVIIALLLGARRFGRTGAAA